MGWGLAGDTTRCWRCYAFTAVSAATRTFHAHTSVPCNMPLHECQEGRGAWLCVGIVGALLTRCNARGTYPAAAAAAKRRPTVASDVGMGTVVSTTASSTATTIQHSDSTPSAAAATTDSSPAVVSMPRSRRGRSARHTVIWPHNTVPAATTVLHQQLCAGVGRVGAALRYRWCRVGSEVLKSSTTASASTRYGTQEGGWQPSESAP